MNVPHVVVVIGDEDRVAVEDALQGIGPQATVRYATTLSPELLGEAEVLACGRLTAEELAAAPRLRWIHFWSAGLDGKVLPGMTERGIQVTNSSGVHGPNIAEHVLAWMLMFTRRMPEMMRAQVAGEWLSWSDAPPAGELTGQTLGIAGLGHIGEAIAVRAAAFGMRIVGSKRDVSVRPNASVPVERLFGPSELPQMLAECDHLVICMAAAESNRGTFDAAMLSNIKAGAYLYNIARGSLIVEAALVEALLTGNIAGAGLDVFEQEPLPKESPLWKMPNVLITPHSAGGTPRYFERAGTIFAENLRRFLTDAPLNNLYRTERGY